MKSIVMSIPSGTVTSQRQSDERLLLPGKRQLVTVPLVLNIAPPQPGPGVRWKKHRFSMILLLIIILLYIYYMNYFNLFHIFID